MNILLWVMPNTFNFTEDPLIDVLLQTLYNPVPSLHVFLGLACTCIHLRPLKTMPWWNILHSANLRIFDGLSVTSNTSATNGYGSCLTCKSIASYKHSTSLWKVPGTLQKPRGKASSLIVKFAVVYTKVSFQFPSFDLCCLKSLL